MHVIRYLTQTSKARAPLWCRFAGLWVLPLLCIVLVATTFLQGDKSGLQSILDRGQLVVVTRTDPVAYYQDHLGDTGFEYELAQRFAQSLGVELKIIKATNLADIYQLLNEGKADLAAAGLTANTYHSQQIVFSQGYLATGNRFVYRKGEPAPSSLDDLNGHSVAVLANSSAAHHLNALVDGGLNIHIKPINAADTANVLASVDNGQADYALVNQQAFTLQHMLFPELSAAFATSKPQHFAWAINKSTDPSLFTAVNRFLTHAQQNGTIKTLAAQFYGDHNPFNLYAARVFIRHLNNRLPKYSATFYAAGQKNQFDWRLLAAMSYQESHWDPDAVSPTGVEGLMMLTQTTATSLGVNRNNPQQSIKGGARYLRYLMNSLPADIEQPDRLWMAIAAYNIGPGHLEDARVLTESQGGDPDDWSDVEQRLPLLGVPEYGNFLRYGMADGKQAVRYVDHIRHYYNLLVWAENAFGEQGTMLAMVQ